MCPLEKYTSAQALCSQQHLRLRCRSTNDALFAETCTGSLLMWKSRRRWTSHAFRRKRSLPRSSRHIRMFFSVTRKCKSIALANHCCFGNHHSGNCTSAHHKLVDKLFTPGISPSLRWLGIVIFSRPISLPRKIQRN